MYYVYFNVIINVLSLYNIVNDRNMLYVMPLYISNYQCSCNIYNCRTQTEKHFGDVGILANIMIITIIIIIMVDELAKKFPTFLICKMRVT